MERHGLSWPNATAAHTQRRAKSDGVPGGGGVCERQPHPMRRATEIGRCVRCEVGAGRLSRGRMALPPRTRRRPSFGAGRGAAAGHAPSRHDLLRTPVMPTSVFKGAFQQRDRWLGAEVGQRGALGGSVRRRMGSGWRSGTREPAGEARHAAGDGGETLAPHADVRDGAEGLPCRGAVGQKRAGRGSCSTISPAYMTATSSQISATTPRSWVMRMMAGPVSARSLASSSRICAWMVTSSAVVGSSAISRPAASERHGDHHALAHAAGELVGIFIGPHARRGDPDALDMSMPSRAPRCPKSAMAHQGFGDLIADGKNRIQRRPRLLEDHGDAVPRRSASPLAQGEELRPSKVTGPDTRAAGSRARESAVTLLPQPDSPTMPSVGRRERSSRRRRLP